MYHSTMTSLLRASSSLNKGGEIGSRCFEAARMSLRAHLKCFPDFKDSAVFTVADYANWLVLSTDVSALHAKADT